MRYAFRFGCALALGLALMAGCSDENGEGGSGGTAGTGGSDLCAGVICEDTECKVDGACNPTEGLCDYTPMEDGTACSEGECLDGVCAPIGAFPCTEQGIRDAIAEGGGPHFFACDGPTTVTTEAEIVINKGVILDGGRNLTVDGQGSHRVFSTIALTTSELRGLGVSYGTASGESSVDKYGGGILNKGTLTLTNSRVSGNTAARGGGGIANWGGGTLTLTSSTVSGNTAEDGRGGGIENFGDGTLTLTNSALLDNAARIAGGIGLDSGTLTLTNSTVSGNTSRTNAGGIEMSNNVAVTLTNSTVSGNTANGAGGGIFNYAATLTLTKSTVSGNAAGSTGGGINNYGTATLTNSTVSRNTADTGDGGGIENYGALTLTNSTVYGNTAANGGGGIHTRATYVSNGMLTLISSTISGNDATDGSAILAESRTALSITNTLLVGDCSIDVVAETSSGGYNIESPGNACGFDQPTDQVSVTAEQLNLGPLQDNGGPTMTHALLTEPEVSVAIDQIPVEDCVDADGAPLTADQRGEPRPGGTMCDVGAFEVQP